MAKNPKPLRKFWKRLRNTYIQTARQPGQTRKQAVAAILEHHKNDFEQPEDIFNADSPNDNDLFALMTDKVLNTP